MSQLPEEELPEDWKERLKRLEKIKLSGVPLDQVFRDLIDEALIASRMRRADLKIGDATPEEKQRTINYVLELGINARNPEILKMTIDVLSKLSDLIQTNRS